MPAIRRKTTGRILFLALLCCAFLTSTPASAQASSAPMVESTETYTSIRDQVLTAFATGADARTLRGLLRPLEAAAKAAPQGSAAQVDLDATLARLFIALRDEPKANAAAQRAWRFAPGHWAANPDVAGHAYLAMASVFTARGYLIDGFRVAEDGMALWQEQPHDAAALLEPQSRFADLISLSAVSYMSVLCSPDPRMMPTLAAFEARRKGRFSWDSMGGPPVLQRGDLKFPSEMAWRGRCGFAVMRFDVTADGRAANIRSVSVRPHASFGDEARKAIEGTRFMAGQPTSDVVQTFLFGIRD